MNRSAKEVLDRLQVVCGVSNDSDLCKLLNLPRTTISTWRGRNSVPYALCVDLAVKHGISLDWLLTGQEPVQRNQKSVPQEELLSKRHEALLSMFDALNEDQKREILSSAQEKERLNKMGELLDEVLKKVG